MSTHLQYMAHFGRCNGPSVFVISCLWSSSQKLVFWRYKNNFTLKYSTLRKNCMLHKHCIFPAFYKAHSKFTQNQFDRSSHWITSCLISNKVVRASFFTPATLTAYTFTIYIRVAYWEFILKIGHGEVAFKTTQVPELRILLCYQKSLFTLSATFYILTYIHYP